MDEAQAQVERLKKALEPFAKYAATVEGPNWLGDLCPLSVAPALPSLSTGISVGDCRRAAEALASIPEAAQPAQQGFIPTTNVLRVEDNVAGVYCAHSTETPQAHSHNFDYTVALQLDEDGDIVARALELPGCMAHGSTVEEALSRLAEIQAMWLKSAAEDNEPLPTKMSGDAFVDLNRTRKTKAQPQSYPCAKCGVSRTEAEGGKIFTVCDECWNGPCWICSKEKGQPPERCHGHYEMPDGTVTGAAPPSESNITEGPRTFTEMSDDAIAAGMPLLSEDEIAIGIAETRSGYPIREALDRSRAEGKAEGRAEGYREGQLRMRERAIEAIPSPGNATWVITNIEALEPEPLPEPPKEGQ